MITSLNAKEWARLRVAAEKLTVAQLRESGRAWLYAVAKRADQRPTQYVSEAIARECEKWCKDRRV